MSDLFERIAALPPEKQHLLLQSLRKKGTYQARVDKLPYYDKLQIPSPPPSPMLRKG